MLFLFVTYPLTSQKIFQILPIGCHNICTIEDNGKCLHQISYMRADYSVKCLSTNTVTLTVAYIAIAIPVGLPVVLFCLLYHYARQATSEVEQDGYFRFESDNSGMEESEMKFALKFLFENYDSSNQFWESLELIRKLILTAGVSMFVGHYKIGINITIIVAFFFVILHAYRHPMKNKFENNLQLLSLSIIPINLCLAAFLKTAINADDVQNKQDNLVIGYILVSLNLLVFLLVCIRLLPKILTIIWGLLKQLYSYCKRKMSFIIP